MSDDILLVKSRLSWNWGRASWRALVFILGAAATGVLGGVVWAALAPLPSYRLLENYTAVMSERGQASIVGADVAFTAIVAVIGIASGIIGWAWFQKASWLVLVAPLVAASLGALACWQVGELIGPSGLTERMAAAVPGDVVSVDLKLRAKAALLVAPFMAITPIMLLAAFWPEPIGESSRAEAVAASSPKT